MRVYTICLHWFVLSFHPAKCSCCFLRSVRWGVKGNIDDSCFCLKKLCWCYHQFLTESRFRICEIWRVKGYMCIYAYININIYYTYLNDCFQEGNIVFKKTEREWWDICLMHNSTWLGFWLGPLKVYRRRENFVLQTRREFWPITPQDWAERSAYLRIFYIHQNKLERKMLIVKQRGDTFWIKPQKEEEALAHIFISRTARRFSCLLATW